MKNELVALMDEHPAGLVPEGFVRRRAGVFEKTVREGLSWRAVVITDRALEPQQAYLEVGVFLVELEPFFEHVFSISRRPGFYCKNVLVLAGRTTTR
ncbi:MAG: hypothetical protein QM708_08460 [Propioniciclava sp.]|uniref:hypothetical protein n=1 Tax=Propioniciclava sp. TaxID=2038686 RepID=UPI0039E539A4